MQHHNQLPQYDSYPPLVSGRLPVPHTILESETLEHKLRGIVSDPDSSKIIDATEDLFHLPSVNTKEVQRVLEVHGLSIRTRPNGKPVKHPYRKIIRCLQRQLVKHSVISLETHERSTRLERNDSPLRLPDIGPFSLPDHSPLKESLKTALWVKMELEPALSTLFQKRQALDSQKNGEKETLSLAEIQKSLLSKVSENFQFAEDNALLPIRNRDDVSRHELSSLAHFLSEQILLSKGVYWNQTSSKAAYIGIVKSIDRIETRLCHRNIPLILLETLYGELNNSSHLNDRGIHVTSNAIYFDHVQLASRARREDDIQYWLQEELGVKLSSSAENEYSGRLRAAVRSDLTFSFQKELAGVSPSPEAEVIRLAVHGLKPTSKYARKIRLGKSPGGVKNTVQQIGFLKEALFELALSKDALYTLAILLQPLFETQYRLSLRGEFHPKLLSEIDKYLEKTESVLSHEEKLSLASELSLPSRVSRRSINQILKRYDLPIYDMRSDKELKKDGKADWVLPIVRILREPPSWYRSPRLAESEVRNATELGELLAQELNLTRLEREPLCEFWLRQLEETREIAEDLNSSRERPYSIDNQRARRTRYSLREGALSLLGRHFSLVGQ